jgi:hypothetical protein
MFTYATCYILLLFIFRIIVIGRASYLILMFIHGGLLINMSRVIFYFSLFSGLLSLAGHVFDSNVYSWWTSN